MDYRGRIEELRGAMRGRGVDLVVFGPGPNHQYLTGADLDWREHIDLMAAENHLFVTQRAAHSIGPWSNEAVDSVQPTGQSYVELVRALARGAGRVGIGEYVHGATMAAVMEACPGAAVVNASHWLDGKRMVKEAEEIARLRAVTALTDEALRRVVGRIGPNSTQREIMMDIECEGRRLGASEVSFAPFSGFMKSGGPAAEEIVNVPVDEPLTKSTAICFDVGFVLDGYASDWGRSVFWGTPPQETVDAHRALREAMHETVCALQPGALRACNIYPFIERELDKRDFGDQMRRRLADHQGMGHSIGVEVHERPWLGVGIEQPLVENMVIAIEPKVWHPGEYYLRQEEIVLIGRDGAEYLTNFDRELFVL